MKKWIALTLALVLALSLFAGCGKGADADETDYASMSIEELKPLLKTVTDGKLTVDERPVYTIKATAGIHGSITPSGDVDVLHGGSQTFTIAANRGYAISNVKIDGVSIGAVKSYTFENVTENHTIEVTFMKANGNPQTGVMVDEVTGEYYVG